MVTIPDWVNGDDRVLVRSESLTLTDVDAKAGVVEVQAVPYEERTELIPDVFEEFEQGAFAAQVGAPSSWSRIKLQFGHDDGQVPLGRAVALEESTTGLRGRFQVNMRLVEETERARGVWLAVENGDLDEVSVGFRSAKKGGTIVKRLEGGKILLRRVRAHLAHLAIVPEGQYGRGATLLAVRDAEAAVKAAEEEAFRVEWAERIARLRGGV